MRELRGWLLERDRNQQPLLDPKWTAGTERFRAWEAAAAAPLLDAQSFHTLVSEFRGCACPPQSDHDFWEGVNKGSLWSENASRGGSRARAADPFPPPKTFPFQPRRSTASRAPPRRFRRLPT